jgi:16S rRNA processing protein RimM
VSTRRPSPQQGPARNAERRSGQDGENRLVCVAHIGAAHGLKGEVRLYSFTEEPEAFARYGPLQTADGARRFDIEKLRAAKDHFIAKLSGIDDRNAAEALRDVELYVPRTRLPEPEDAETFYHADLIGLSVVGRTGEALGSVVALHNFGAGDLLEIALKDGSTVLLPFTETAVPIVDVAGGRIVVAPPEGLLPGKTPASDDAQRAPNEG